MSARAIPIVETPRIVSLTARLALLEAECIDFRRDLNRAIETPFGLRDVRAEAAELEARFGPNVIDELLTGTEDVQRYDADEDDHGPA